MSLSDTFKRRRYSPRFRHDQACWCAGMFLNEWGAMAAEYGWNADDIFAMPSRGKSGLAYWIETELVTALGPEHAVTETNRVYDQRARIGLIRTTKDSLPVEE
jgi:hypothetical protein